MGADLLLWYAPIPEAPAWDAALEYIAEHEGDDPAFFDIYEADELRTKLTEFRAYIDGQERRDVTTLTFAGQKYVFTGGMSWGDSPTDFSDVMQALGESGVLHAAGFVEADTNAVTIRLAPE